MCISFDVSVEVEIRKKIVLIVIILMRAKRFGKIVWLFFFILIIV
jgi:hypothetical protein